jgi:hypothetical protein
MQACPSKTPLGNLCLSFFGGPQTDVVFAHHRDTSCC